MKKIYLSFILLYLAHFSYAQEDMDSLKYFFVFDSIATLNLNEVVIIGNPAANYLKETKALGSLDSYLAQSKAINMVKRGAYAWEPMLNGMSTERSILTIEGMRIFQACTDKMDPITSYLENTNLSGAKIEEGQSGSEFGSTIAGSINLMRRKGKFNAKKKLGGSVFAGFESNNLQQIYGATLSHSSSRFFTDLDFTYRDAENYKAGRKAGQNMEVLYSQFSKYNLSAVAGYKINKKQEMEASAIYDRATDVGYPGLPMDVSLAEALITSLQHRYRNPADFIHLWESKIYFNTITHIMDDSYRPVVPIRMDMPGWSKTAGLYSKLHGHYHKHSFKATLSGYLNNSLAEMTMYPNNPEEKEMFMLTWPDVDTWYGGLNLRDNFSINHHLVLVFQGGIGIQHNKIKSASGLNSLRIFYPDIKAGKTRFLPSLSTQLSYHHNSLLYQLGLGYGERAPSVSEAYGFYLLNINDNYDYIGNPYLKNEKSFNIELSSTYESEKFTAAAKVNYFHFLDYIIGKPRPGILPMNMTAEGIKIYEHLPQASILNTSLSMEYQPIQSISIAANASYRYGQGVDGTILPLIQPFQYNLATRYNQTSFFLELSIDGSSKNRNSIEFGETQKPAYIVFNATASKTFRIKTHSLTAKAGVENILNKYYSSFDDWFGIPRMGRNIYVNLVYSF